MRYDEWLQRFPVRIVHTRLRRSHRRRSLGGSRPIASSTSEGSLEPLAPRGSAGTLDSGEVWAMSSVWRSMPGKETSCSWATREGQASRMIGHVRQLGVECVFQRVFAVWPFAAAWRALFGPQLRSIGTDRQPRRPIRYPAGGLLGERRRTRCRYRLRPADLSRAPIPNGPWNCVRSTTWR